jgi:hypothetical protein
MDLRPTQSDLRITFEHKDGGLYWVLPPLHNDDLLGERFGSTNGVAARRGRVYGKKYLEHVLIWVYHKGYYPENQIDHRDRDNQNNAIDNLREATQTCNQQNRLIRSDNTSSIPGVHPRDGNYRAVLTYAGEKLSLGTYQYKLEAALARYTCEVWHRYWTCNNNSELVKSIKKIWPEFKGE